MLEGTAVSKAFARTKGPTNEANNCDHQVRTRSAYTLPRVLKDHPWGKGPPAACIRYHYSNRDIRCRLLTPEKSVSMVYRWLWLEIGPGIDFYTNNQQHYGCVKVWRSIPH